MIAKLNALRVEHPARFGVLLSLLGVLILTPDTLVMRLSGLEQWALVGWRGVLMGVVLLGIWRLGLAKAPAREWRTLMTVPGLVVILSFGFNSITFTLGIVETSVTIVLTAVATMPAFAAVLSRIWLGERQGRFGWLAIVGVMAGVALIVSDGGNAEGTPAGSPLLGAVYGMLTAFSLALTFTTVRRYPSLSVLPAAAIGALLSGLLGLFLSPVAALMAAPWWTVVVMGGVILPLSFTCLNLAPRYTTAAVVSLVMLLEMVMGPFWVWLGAGERPTPTMIAGAVFVIVVLIVYLRHTDRADRVPAS